MPAAVTEPRIGNARIVGLKLPRGIAIREAMSGTSDAAGGAALVGGRYQLLNLLGRGGMGETHRVVDRLSGRVVTLKRLKVAEVATVLERLSRSDSRLA